MLARTPPSRAEEARNLRAEARLVTMAGVILLAIGLPLTLVLAAIALAGGMSYEAPLLAGAPPILLGWAACFYGSRRLERAQHLEGRPQNGTSPAA